MDYFDGQRQDQFKLLVFIVVVTVILLNHWLKQSYPLIARYLLVSIIILGIPTFVASLFMFGRYSKIYDHEPTSLLGRPTTGKGARQVLLNTGFAGVTMSVTGIFLWFLN